MGVILLVQSCITLAKTLRDNHEATKFLNRIEPEGFDPIKRRDWAERSLAFPALSHFCRYNA
jgi:hypothetical protein